MDHGPPETPAGANRPRPAAGWALGDCPECLTRYTPKHPRQLFCCEAHQRTYNDRWKVRGRAIAILAVADRQTRGGTQGDCETGKKARRDHQALCQRYVVDDRAAPRMTAIDFARLRYSLGFDRP